MRAFRIGSHILHADRQLLLGGRRVAIGPRALAILSELARRHGEVVSKDELFDAVWHDLTVEENALQVHIAALRKAMGNDGHLIETIRSIGYELRDVEDIPYEPETGDEQTALTDDDLPVPASRFAGSFGARGAVIITAFLAALLLGVAGWWITSNDQDAAAEAVPPKLASVAVLPFIATSSGADDQYFADGLTEEILNRLSTLSELDVSSRTAVFYFRDRPMQPVEIARQLGVGHLVEGTVRREEDAVRVTARLIDAANDTTLWSKSYDANGSASIDIQADIAEQVAAALDVLLDEEKRAAMQEAGIDNPEAFALYAKALDTFQEAHQDLSDLRTLETATALFLEAQEMEPSLWKAPYLAADFHNHLMWAHLGEYPEEEIDPAKLPKAHGELVSLLRQSRDAARRPDDRNHVALALKLAGSDWSGLRDIEADALQSDMCITMLYPGYPSGLFDRSEDWYQFSRQQRPCDPFTTGGIMPALIMAIWADRGDDALAILDEEGGSEILSTQGEAFVRFHVLLAKGWVTEALQLASDTGLPPGLVAMVTGDMTVFEEMGVRLDEDSIARLHETIGVLDAIMLAGRMGRTDIGNLLAADLDKKPGSSVFFLQILMQCMCGAPFDLQATPNFAARLREAGIRWPPKSPIDWAANRASFN